MFKRCSRRCLRQGAKTCKDNMYFYYMLRWPQRTWLNNIRDAFDRTLYCDYRYRLYRLSCNYVKLWSTLLPCSNQEPKIRLWRGNKGQAVVWYDSFQICPGAWCGISLSKRERERESPLKACKWLLEFHPTGGNTAETTTSSHLLYYKRLLLLL